MGRLLLLLWLPLNAAVVDKNDKAHGVGLHVNSGEDTDPPVKKKVDDEQFLEEKKRKLVEKLKTQAALKKKAKAEKEALQQRVQEPPQSPPLGPADQAGGFAPSSVGSGRGEDVTAAPSEQALRSQQEAQRQLGSSSRKAVGRALSAARGLRNAMPSLDAGALGAQGQTEAARAGQAADPLRDLAVAQAGGTSHAFRELGLQARADQAGRLQVVRADGAAATPAEVAALRQRLAEQPEALSRHPHFFAVLEPQSFAELKSDFVSASPEQRATTFRDVMLSPAQRDFRWSRSCSSVSGDCNPHAAALSYERGSFVPPKDLKQMHEELHPEDEDLEAFLSESEYTEEEEKEASQALTAVRGPRGGLAARLGLDRLLARIGFDSAPSRTPDSAASAQEASVVAWARPGRSAVAVSEGPQAAGPALAYRSDALPPQKAGAGAPLESPAPLLPRLLAGLGLGLLLLGLARKTR